MIKQRVWLSLPGLKQAISVLFVLCLLVVATLSLAPSASASSWQVGGAGKRCQIVLDRLHPGERSSRVLSSQCVEGDQALVAPLGRTILMTWYKDINYGGDSTDVYGWDGPCDQAGYGFEYVGAFWDDTITSRRLEERELCGAKRRLGQTRKRDLREVLVIVLLFDGVLGDGNGLVLHFEQSIIHPHRDWSLRQAPLSIELPVLKAQEPIFIQMARVAGGEQDTVKELRLPATRR